LIILRATLFLTTYRKLPQKYDVCDERNDLRCLHGDESRPAVNSQNTTSGCRLEHHNAIRQKQQNERRFGELLHYDIILEILQRGLQSKLTDEDKIGIGSATNTSEGGLGRVCKLSSHQQALQFESAWKVMTDVFLHFN
jgi:hypothetical protein